MKKMLVLLVLISFTCAGWGNAEEWKKGDIIKGRWSLTECRIIDEKDGVLLTSARDNFNKIDKSLYTKTELESSGWYLKKKEKMITINGKSYSEQTIKNALREYVR